MVKNKNRLFIGIGFSALLSGFIGCQPGDVPVYAEDRQGDSTPGLDEDGDWYEGTSDCNDRNAAIHPGAAEFCGDGVDQDCDGVDSECSH